ncbi:hypothetical protein, partial [Nocardioides sp.]
VGLIAGGAATLPGLGVGGPARGSDVVAGESAEKPQPRPDPQPAQPDRALAVAARDIPATIGELLGSHDVTTVLRGADYPVIDEPHTRLAHFRYRGTLTTVWIQPADELASCQELAASPDTESDETAPPAPRARCAVVNGLEVLTNGPQTGVTVKTNGATVWQHGYAVSLVSYNAAAGKNPDGSEDVPAVTDDPAIGIDRLTEIASSQVWFE